MDAKIENLTIHGDVKNPIEIILREGEAGRNSYPKKYTQQGIISSPREYSPLVVHNHASVVEFSYQNKTIKLLANPTDSDAAEITGSLTLNPDLVAFGINKDRFFKGSELIKHVRKYAHCFKSPEEAKELIQSLQNFEVAFEQINSKSDDRKGNTEEHIKNAIKFHKGEIKSKITLSLPLFIGSEKVAFEIEVEVDREGTTPVFGFYSIYMETIIQEQSMSIINAEIEILAKKFTCIQLS